MAQDQAKPPSLCSNGSPPAIGLLLTLGMMAVIAPRRASTASADTAARRSRSARPGSRPAPSGFVVEIRGAQPLGGHRRRVRSRAIEGGETGGRDQQR